MILATDELVVSILSQQNRQRHESIETIIFNIYLIPPSKLKIYY